MEKQYVAPTNGVEFLTTDANGLGTASALADDRALHELLRAIPYNGASPGKYIVPSGYAGGGAGASAAAGTNQPTVVPATGSVNVFPFRAIVGSTTPVAGDPLEGYRGARSGVFTGASMGAATLQYNQSFANNASGNPRWDMVYAAVSVAAAQASVTRLVKAPSTGVITSQSVSPGIQCTVTIGVVAGTPGATPAYPSAPADGGGVFNIPLAFVRIANGFTGATVLAKSDVEDIAPILPVHPATGAATARPVQYASLYTGTAAALLNQGSGTEKWPASGNRPGTYMAPTMVGEEVLWIPLRFITINTVPLNTITTIDTSVDFRGRIFKWEFFALNTGKFPWDPTATNNTVGIFQSIPFIIGTNYQYGIGASMGSTDATYSANHYTIMDMASGNISQMTGGSGIRLLVDSTNGNLRVSVSNTTPNITAFIRLTASGPFPNV